MAQINFECAIGFADAIEVNTDGGGVVDIGAEDSNNIIIVGSDAITGFGTGANRLRFVDFEGNPTLVHSASLSLPSGLNRESTSGGKGVYVSDKDGNWREISFTSPDPEASIATVPTGTSIWFNAKRAPSGYLVEDGSAVLSETYDALFEVLCPREPVTLTIASPCVISWTSHQLSAGDPVKFKTAGALPTGLVAGTTYYVIATGLTADVFRVSATLGGAAINTSGSQSGVHTAYHVPFGCASDFSTFNLPDVRGEFVRGLDNGRGVDVSRVLGAAQAQDLQPHSHEYTGEHVSPVGTGSDSGSATYASGTSNTGAAGVTETRPRNVTKISCIKY